MTFSSTASGNVETLPAAALASIDQAPNGKGRLALRFSRGAASETYIGGQYASYPFHICRPQYLDGDPPGMATLYIQSSSGGIFEDDRLSIAIEVAHDARAHLTTQGATVVHGMRAGAAEQRVTLVVGEGSFLEYMPGPTILFPDARLRSRLRIVRHPSAIVVCTDAFMCHDPSARGVPFGFLDNLMEVEDEDGRLRVRDSFTVTGEMFLRHLRGVNGPFAMHGTMVVLCPPDHRDALLSGLRGIVRDLPDAVVGVSDLPNGCGVMVRILAVDGASLLTATLAAWSAAREALFGRPPSPRRK